MEEDQGRTENSDSNGEGYAQIDGEKGFSAESRTFDEQSDSNFANKNEDNPINEADVLTPDENIDGNRLRRRKSDRTSLLDQSTSLISRVDFVENDDHRSLLLQKGG